MLSDLKSREPPLRNVTLEGCTGDWRKVACACALERLTVQAPSLPAGLARSGSEPRQVAVTFAPLFCP